MSQYDSAQARESTIISNRSARPEVDVTAEVVTPVDRVRWGPILAGLVTALSSLAVHGVLGAAIAGSAYDPGDSAHSFGIGAGIWGIISVLVSFALGGWVAARSAAVRGHNNGLLNGAMVWAVAIPLMAYLLAGGASRMANTAALATHDAVQSSARVTAGGVSEPMANGEPMRASAQMTPDQKERAADAGARTAWGTLVALLLGLAAAATGGYLGARETRHHVGDSTERLGRPVTA